MNWQLFDYIAHACGECVDGWPIDRLIGRGGEERGGEGREERGGDWEGGLEGREAIQWLYTRIFIDITLVIRP